MSYRYLLYSNMQALQQGTILQSGKYIIKKVLGQGGFGITYLAENTMLEGKVAIKEFFFKEYCDRDDASSHVTIGTSGNRELVERFKQKFIKEARTIFKLNHPNIVRILDIFEENGTAYYVMDYIEGETLGDMVKHRGAIPEAEAVGYIKEVASALSYIHGEKINHLDIKPGNIMKRGKDGKILLIDFGVSKQYDAETAEGTTTTPVGISHGYSPTEQYQRHGVQSFSPQSDVYALAATLYKLLTGITPPEAMIIQDEGLPVDELKSIGISSSVISAIEAAMLSRSKRTQNIAAWLNLLENKNSADEETTRLNEDSVAAEYSRLETLAKRTEAECRTKAEAERESRGDARIIKGQESKARKHKRNLHIGVIITALIVVIALCIFLLGGNGGGNPLPLISISGTEEIVDVSTSSNSTTGTHRGHDWVDLGLPSGTKWATMNVGANSPSDYGSYFAWGETSPKNCYIWETLKYRTSGDNFLNITFSKYVTDSKYGNVDDKMELDSDDDVASQNWGAGWYMPTKVQQDELLDKCKWAWTTMGGHNGYEIVGPNGNSIFMPAAGYCDVSKLIYAGTYGYYWSCSLVSNNQMNAYNLYINAQGKDVNSSNRHYGHNVRPVLSPRFRTR